MDATSAFSGRYSLEAMAAGFVVEEFGALAFKLDDECAIPAAWIGCPIGAVLSTPAGG